MKNQKAITLIALIITIIVLLILAGVTINMVLGENGLFNKAKTSIAKYENAQAKENTSLSQYESEIDKYMDGHIEGTLPLGTYTIGQEVTLEGENFFVIADNGNTVTLLSKYNLNQEGTEQLNGTRSATGRVFSSTNYWSSDFTSNPFDLQTYTTSAIATSNSQTVSNNAILMATEYGRIKKAKEGRLLKYSEAESILNSSDENIIKILKGNDYTTDPLTENYMLFWIGDAYNNTDVYYVSGYSGQIAHKAFHADIEIDGVSLLGVRPVLIVGKS